jgi:hypothetical protein
MHEADHRVFVWGPWIFREDETQFLQNGVSMTAIIHHQDYLNDGEAI